jgi:hypothetical protein
VIPVVLCTILCLLTCKARMRNVNLSVDESEGTIQICAQFTAQTTDAGTIAFVPSTGDAGKAFLLHGGTVLEAAQPLAWISHMSVAIIIVHPIQISSSDYCHCKT